MYFWPLIDVSLIAEEGLVLDILVSDEPRGLVVENVVFINVSTVPL